MCKRCGRALRWVPTVCGYLLPLDPEPAPGGCIELLPASCCRVVPVEERAACSVPLYTSHFATCPAVENVRALMRAGKARYLAKRRAGLA